MQKNERIEGIIMNLKLIGLNASQCAAVAEISNILDIECSETGIPIHFKQSDKGISIKYDGHSGTITYEHDHQYIRALGLMIEKMKQELLVELTELPVYESLGFMIDCSRNAVIHFEGYRKLIQHLALMGYSTVQLYTEDTFEMKEYPYFGHMRGRFSGEQLKHMDTYAMQFGIELIPCIQTLAHLEQPLKWAAFSDIVDCNDILLVGEEKTYQLIDTMFRTLSENLSSRTINIGMDEAHMMGLGKYLDKHGYQDRVTVMLQHFEKVVAIARKYGYKPMMWSDMFFRLASGGEYYEADSQIREDVIAMIPEDVTLVYWDYYSENTELYNRMIKKHKQLSDKIVFAGGAWKWMGFTPNNEFSKHVGVMAHESCLAGGVKEILMTAWGDNGAESSLFSILPTLQLWAELCYKNNSNLSTLEQRFMTCTGGSYNDFMKLDLPNLVPDNVAPGASSINPPKYILYQDILMGLFDKHIIPKVYAEHYESSAKILEQCMERNSKWKSLFETQYALCKLLELKCDIGNNIREAYMNNNLTLLQEYAKVILPELKRRTQRFMSTYREQWEQENKIFGLDVFDIRMGGLLQRMDTAIYRILGYISGRISQLEELEHERLYYDGRTEDRQTVAITANVWHRIATPSVLSGMI
ncbi:MAG: family 20 glycosylhydrolase [Candidatus Pristimantibacillus lignocellulolyticus]|uniref:Family 20 glycosylhydrolase n=1 Tax=Candidatus Pristimantibacillus lignocellulolyticus TaxID=2994561 RepID=A0A9J6ZH55_9BACL|nr:MAG: family 20 glycosylhydrolase [Candidatus Pristimantibacillus lignocellulolyticus]